MNGCAERRPKDEAKSERINIHPTHIRRRPYTSRICHDYPLQLQKSGRSSDVSKRGCRSRMERTYVLARPTARATASHSAPGHGSHVTRLYDRGDGMLGDREMSIQL
jgi:hypothetical protein